MASLTFIFSLILNHLPFCVYHLYLLPFGLISNKISDLMNIHKYHCIGGAC